MKVLKELCDVLDVTIQKILDASDHAAETGRVANARNLREGPETWKLQELRKSLKASDEYLSQPNFEKHFNPNDINTEMEIAEIIV